MESVWGGRWMVDAHTSQQKSSLSLRVACRVQGAGLHGDCALYVSVLYQVCTVLYCICQCCTLYFRDCTPESGKPIDTSCPLGRAESNEPSARPKAGPPRRLKHRHTKRPRKHTQRSHAHHTRHNGTVGILPGAVHPGPGAPDDEVDSGNSASAASTR